MRIILLISTVLLLSACDHFPRYQYNMGENKTGFANRICTELAALSQKHNLLNRKPVRPETLCYFSDSDQNNVVLGAKEIDDQIVIDIQGFNSKNEIASLREATENMISSKYPYVQISR